MSIRNERQLHAGIGRDLDNKLREIAKLEAMTKSQLVRQVLLRFVRSYASEGTGTANSDNK